MTYPELMPYNNITMDSVYQELLELGMYDFSCKFKDYPGNKIYCHFRIKGCYLEVTAHWDTLKDLCDAMFQCLQKRKQFDV